MYLLRALKLPSDRVDRLQAVTETTHRFSMGCELAVRQISELEIRDSLESGPGQLGSYLFLAIVGCNQE